MAITAILGALAGIGSAVGGAAGAVGGAVGGAAGAIGGGLGAAGGAIGSGLGAAGGALGSGLSAAGGALGSAGSAIGSGLGTLGTSIGQAAGPALQGIGQGLGTIGSNIGQGFGVAGQGISQGFQTAVGPMANALQGVGQGAGGIGGFNPMQMAGGMQSFMPQGGGGGGGGLNFPGRTPGFNPNASLPGAQPMAYTPESADILARVDNIMYGGGNRAGTGGHGSGPVFSSPQPRVSAPQRVDPGIGPNTGGYPRQLRTDLAGVGADPNLASDPRAAAQALDPQPGLLERARGWIDANVSPETQRFIGNQIFNQQERDHERALTHRLGSVPAVGPLAPAAGLMGYFPQGRPAPQYRRFGL